MRRSSTFGRCWNLIPAIRRRLITLLTCSSNTGTSSTRRSSTRKRRWNWFQTGPRIWIRSVGPHYQKRQYPTAIRYLERASASNQSAAWKYHLAMAYAKAGDLTRGRATLAAALKQNPRAPEAKAAQEVVGTFK